MTTHVPRILGTTADVYAGSGSDRRASKLERTVIDEVVRLESIFNLFDPMSVINQLRGQGRTDVPELDEVMKLAKLWRIRTAGAFNPWVEGLRSLWSEAEVRQEVPSHDSVVALVAQGAGAEPSLSDLNLNAIAKGWIVDRAIDAVMELRRPPQSCWVSIGGDVAHRGQGSITVGIEDPFRPFDNAEPLATIELSNQALATSGGTRRYWTIADQKFSHVVDPRTGWPVDHVASASVNAADAASADVLATAITVLQVNESLELIEATPDASCLIVDSDRTIHTSANWPD